MAAVLLAGMFEPMDSDGRRDGRIASLSTHYGCLARLGVGGILCSAFEAYLSLRASRWSQMFPDGTRCFQMFFHVTFNIFLHISIISLGGGS